MVNFVQDIKDFHEKFELTYKGPPRILEEDLFGFRYMFMNEELNEYGEAWAIDDKAAQLDALVDLLYVVFGTAYLQGFNIQEAWRRVHEANMKKIRALTRDASKRDSIYDVVKPEGWKPPNLEDLV